MTQPPGYVDTDFPSPEYVCELGAPLYGAPESGRNWQDEATAVAIAFDLRPTANDPCLYRRWVDNQLLLLATHVDDFLLFADTTTLADSFEAHLRKHFPVKSGPIADFLGIEITYNRDSGRMLFSQEQYIRSLLKDAGLAEAHPVGTPAVPHSKLRKSAPAATKIFPLRQLTGSVLYATVSTRPDTAQPIADIARFQDAQTDEAIAAMKHLLRYLAGTPNYGLDLSPSGPLVLSGWVDATWADDLDDRKSTSGWILFLAGAPVSWGSRKQKSVSRSSTEAEYIAASDCAAEMIWQRNLLAELGFPALGPSDLYEDNQGAIGLALNDTNTSRIKHIDIRHHWLRECVEAGTIRMRYAHTKEQLADSFTKALPKEQFVTLRARHRVVPI
jgi:hypothetical protein